jgi:phosphatidylinositol glycan class Z
VLWWKTYSPPVWLANSNSTELKTLDLMGRPAAEIWQALQVEVGTCSEQKKRGPGEVALVAPSNKAEIEMWRQLGGEDVAVSPPKPAKEDLALWPRADELSWGLLGEELRHIGLDDLDFAEDGVWDTLARVVGHRGLRAWRVRRRC